MLESAALDLVTPGFAIIYTDSYDDDKDQYVDLCNVRASKKYEEKVSALGGVSAWEVKTPSQDMTYEEFQQGYDVTMTQVAYQKGIRVQRELLDDELYNKVKAIPDDMGRGARVVVEQVISNHINNGFTTALADGVVLFSTAHPLLGGGTEANTQTAADIDITQLRTAILTMKETTDQKGMLLGVKPVSLVIPPENQFLAQELLKSAKDPESAQNTINPLAGTLGIVINEYLTDADSWNLRAKKQMIEMFWHTKPEFSSFVDPFNKDGLFHGYARFSSGVGRWYGWYGVAGV